MRINSMHFFFRVLSLVTLVVFLPCFYERIRGSSMVLILFLSYFFSLLCVVSMIDFGAVRVEMLKSY